MKDSFLRDLLFFVRKNKIISFSLLAFLVSFIFFAFMSVWIFFQNKTVITYTKTGYSTSGTLQLDIKMEIPFKSEGVKNCWQEGNGTWGSQYDIYIYNNSKYPFLDWELSMTVPEEARIDSSWNAEYVPTPGKISITGLDQFFTTEIHPKNSIKLGFVLYTNELMQKSDFILIGRFVRNPLKEASCITALVCLAVSLIVLIVSLFFYRTIKIQSAIDDEKIDSLLKLCARFIDTRDEYTKIHSSHVGFYSKEIAKEMGFDEEFQKNIYYMGMMHDVGKVLIPKEILCKPGKLSDEEWAEMKKHTSYGAEILSDFAAVKGIREAALCHHERYDGKGYPRGLHDKEIPIQARIIAVADSYDAMHTNRSYRSRLSDDVILSELEKNKGIQFDPDVAEAMLRLLRKKGFL